MAVKTHINLIYKETSIFGVVHLNGMHMNIGRR